MTFSKQGLKPLDINISFDKNTPIVKATYLDEHNRLEIVMIYQAYSCLIDDDNSILKLLNNGRGCYFNVNISLDSMIMIDSQINEI